MPRCREIKKVFVTDVQGFGRGPAAYEKALEQFNKKVDAATKATGRTYKGALKWTKETDCARGCTKSGQMVISPYVTKISYEVKRNPTRVWLKAQAGVLAVIFCEPEAEAAKKAAKKTAKTKSKGGCKTMAKSKSGCKTAPKAKAKTKKK